MQLKYLISHLWITFLPHIAEYSKENRNAVDNQGKLWDFLKIKDSKLGIHISYVWNGYYLEALRWDWLTLERMSYNADLEEKKKKTPLLHLSKQNGNLRYPLHTFSHLGWQLIFCTDGNPSFMYKVISHSC